MQAAWMLRGILVTALSLYSGQICWSFRWPSILDFVLLWSKQIIFLHKVFYCWSARPGLFHFWKKEERTADNTVDRPFFFSIHSCKHVYLYAYTQIYRNNHWCWWQSIVLILSQYAILVIIHCYTAYTEWDFYILNDRNPEMKSSYNKHYFNVVVFSVRISDCISNKSLHKNNVLYNKIN